MNIRKRFIYIPVVTVGVYAIGASLIYINTDTSVDTPVSSHKQIDKEKPVAEANSEEVKHDELVASPQVLPTEVSDKREETVENAYMTEEDLRQKSIHAIIDIMATRKTPHNLNAVQLQGIVMSTYTSNPSAFTEDSYKASISSCIEQTATLPRSTSGHICAL